VKRSTLAPLQMWAWHLLAMGILLCAGACLSLLPTELDASAALTTPHSHHHLDQGTNEGYLAVAPEEAQDADGRPVNADLLSTLLLAVCFGATVGWPLTNGQGRRTFRFVGVDQCPSFVTTACKDRSFLEVFRL
jgi:hypothetical protein